SIDEAAKHVRPPRLQLSHKQLERPAPQSQEIVLVRLEPGPILLSLQLEQKLKCLVREPAKFFDRRGRRRHVAQCTLQNMSTYVLVHGAWGGSFGWRKVRPLLQRAGHAVFSPSLPGLGERGHLGPAEGNLGTSCQDV